MRTAKQQAWVETHAIKPEWLPVARQVMDEIQDGRPVMDALRMHPLAGGGYLAKYVLVSGVSRDGARRRVAGRPGLAGPAAHEAGAHALRRDHGDRSDQALSLPRQVHLLPDRCAHAEIVPSG